MQKQKGFTLLELLVVIAVIGMLASVILSAVNTARKKGRNARRIADVQQLSTAFNVAVNSTTANIPDTTGSPGGWACISLTCYGGWSTYVASATVDAFTAAYVRKPGDPSDGGARTLGGYLLTNPWGGANSPYDGTYLPPGVYIGFANELPVTSGICGGGFIWGVGASWVHCLKKID